MAQKKIAEQMAAAGALLGLLWGLCAVPIGGSAQELPIFSLNLVLHGLKPHVTAWTLQEMGLGRSEPLAEPLAEPPRATGRRRGTAFGLSGPGGGGHHRAPVSSASQSKDVIRPADGASSPREVYSTHPEA